MEDAPPAGADITDPLPAWSLEDAGRIAASPVPNWPAEITRDWAWGGSTGAGVRVCVVDSGFEVGHPGIGAVAGAYAVSVDEAGIADVTVDETGDVSGHGTACASVIRSLAPDCELTSMRVLTRGRKGSRGMGVDLLAGIAWAAEEGFDVVSLSLATTRRRFVQALYETVDAACFGRTTIVASANNMPHPGFPWRFSSVISVGSHEGTDPLEFFWNPEPPVEAFARGIDVEVAWTGGTWTRASGNSFATPHISGILALILGKHPGMTPYELKTVLRATASQPRMRNS
jgi:subtilisin family serine protease